MAISLVGNGARLFPLIAMLGLCSCANFYNGDQNSVAAAREFRSFLRDDLFYELGDEPEIEKIQLLELPAPTKNYLDAYVVGLKTEQERYKALRQWVFDRFSSYEYDTSETLSIANLISARKINCLSFSNLFVAAARYVNIPANFQLVYAPPYWDGNNDTWIVNQHVNVFGDIKVVNTSTVIDSDFNWFTGSKVFTSTRSGRGNIKDSKIKTKRRYVVDINRAIVSVPFQTKALNDDQILSLFYNNKASEAIQRNDSSLAYKYIKAALEADASLSSVWNGLGVLYQRIGQYELAKQVYLTAIALEDESYTAKSNLVNVYRFLEETDSADALNREVKTYREENPYYHYSLGESSLANNDARQAADHFTNAIAIKHNEQLFYYALAKAQVKLGQYDLVAENLKNARIYAKGGEKSRYTNKLKKFEEAIAVHQVTN